MDAAVAAEQAYETEQIKKAFHTSEAKTDFTKVVAETEVIRQPLAAAIAAAKQPVTHTIQISNINELKSM